MNRDWKSCADEGIALYKNLKFFEAESKFKESVRRARDESVAPADLAASLQNLSVAYHARAKYLDSQSVLKEALHLLENEKGSQSSYVRASCLATLAQILSDFEELDKSIELYQSAIKDLEGDENFAAAAAAMWYECARIHAYTRQLDQFETSLQNFERWNKLSYSLKQPRMFSDRVLTSSPIRIGTAWSQPCVEIDEQEIEAKVRGSVLNLKAYVHLLGQELKEATALCKEVLATTGESDREGTRVYSYQLLASIADKNGDLEDAERYGVLGLEMGENIVPGPHPWLARWLVWLACIFTRRFRMEEAEHFAKRAIGAMGDCFDEWHPEIALFRMYIATTNLRTWLKNQDQLTEAVSIFRQSLESLQSVYEDEHSLVIQARYRLAIHLKLGRRYTEAEEELKTAAKSAIGVKHRGDQLRFDCLMRLIDLYQETGRLPELFDRITEATKLLETSIDLDSRKRTDALIELSGASAEIGQNEEAKHLLTEALSLSRQGDRVRLSRCLTSLIALALDENDVIEAETLIAELVELTKNLAPVEHINARYLQARVFLMKRLEKEGEDLMLEILSESEQHLPDTRQPFLVAAANLVELYLNQSRLYDTERICNQVYANRHLDSTARMFSGAILVRALAERFANERSVRAEALYQQALSWLEEVPTLTSSLVADFLLEVGAYYSALKKSDQAETCFKKSLKLKEEIYGEEHLELAQPLLGLAQCLVSRDPHQAEVITTRVLNLVEERGDILADGIVATLEVRSEALKKLNRFDESNACKHRAEQLRKSPEKEGAEDDA